MQVPEFDRPHAACPHCGDTRLSELFVDHRTCRICICEGCRVQFMNPPYTDAHLDAYYSQYIRVEDKWEEPRVSLQRFYLSLVGRHTTPLRRLFDIGTGRGYMLTAAKEKGIEAVGYDVDADAAREVAKFRGAPVLGGSIRDVDLEPGSFDAVVMHHVLEHLKQPIEYFETIETLLRPGGTLFVAVPNVASVSIRTKATLELLGIRRANLGRYYDTSHHLFYYTPASLRQLLLRRGYKPLQIRGCHRVRPNEPAWRRWYNRNIYDQPTWRSGFLIIARFR